MENKQSKILDTLEETLNDASKKMEASAIDASNGLYDEIIGDIEALKRNNIGTVLNSIENLKAIQAIKPKIDQYFKGDYSKAVKDYLKDYTSTSKLIDDYFVSILDNYERNEIVYKQISQSNVFTTVDSLLGSGIDANFKTPLIDGLQKQVSSGTSISDLKAFLKVELISQPTIKRYISQVSSDAIRQYSRQYMNTVSDDLGLKHYLYRGTAISDTRSFCQAKHGKYFTKEQVQKWGNQGDWSGKIAGTNEINIFVNLGGWNCRHSLIPVSESIYNKYSNK
jgi:hypothetical protein